MPQIFHLLYIYFCTHLYISKANQIAFFKKDHFLFKTQIIKYGSLNLKLLLRSKLSSVLIAPLQKKKKKIMTRLNKVKQNACWANVEFVQSQLKLGKIINYCL